MPKFKNLDYQTNYDIIDAESCYPIHEGIQGCDAMSTIWPEGAEAYVANGNKTYFDDDDNLIAPVEVAS